MECVFRSAILKRVENGQNGQVHRLAFLITRSNSLIFFMARILAIRVANKKI
jgi:hypothetical protein